MWHKWLWVRTPAQTFTNACRHVCKYRDWKAWLPCWPLNSQQVSHQRWIWGSYMWESMQGIHHGFETQGRCHQKPKTAASVAPQKRTYVLQHFFKKCCWLFWSQLCDWVRRLEDVGNVLAFLWQLCGQSAICSSVISVGSKRGADIQRLDMYICWLI